MCRARSKRDGTRAETRFDLSAKRTSPFKSAGGGQFSRLLAVEECGSADRPWIDHVPTYSARLLATHSIRIFPLNFPSHASPCAITFRTAYTSVQLIFHTVPASSQAFIGSWDEIFKFPFDRSSRPVLLDVVSSV